LVGGQKFWPKTTQDQGCQIFIGTKYQNGENIPIDCNIYQMATKYVYQHLPMQDPKKFTQIGVFGFENMPSGNTAQYGCLLGRVARWYFFKPKIPIWVNFGGSCNGKCWYIRSILLPFGLFYGHLVYFPPFWYIVPRKIWQSCY
jgi:hypothetical protein